MKKRNSVSGNLFIDEISRHTHDDDKQEKGNNITETTQYTTQYLNDEEQDNEENESNYPRGDIESSCLHNIYSGVEVGIVIFCPWLVYASTLD
jgi:hypothetical protein